MVVVLCPYIWQEIKYAQNLKKLCLECQKKISKLKQDIIGDSSMKIKFENKISDDEKNKYINDLTEKDNQINELEFQLKYITSFKSPLTLNFKWSYLLFGIPFFVDLYKFLQRLKRYTQDLVELLSDYQKDLAKYKKTFDEKKEINEKIRNKSIDDMQNENENKNGYNTDKDVSKYQDLTDYKSIMTDDIKTDDNCTIDGNDYDNKFSQKDEYKNFLISKDNQIRELKVKLEYCIQLYKDGDR